MKPVPENARRLATTAEACAYGHMSYATLFRLIAARKITAYRRERRQVLVDLNSIDAYNNTLPEVC